MLAIIFAVIVTILVLILFKDFKKSLSSILILVITTIFIYMILIHIDFFNNIIIQSNYPIYDKLVLILNSMSIAILIDGIFSHVFQSLYENKIIKKYEKMVKSPNYEYYRDILQTKSPAILSYCYNRKLNIEDEVVAILLNLQKKGIIDLTENKLIIIGSTDGLKSHEKYMLNNIEKIYSNRKTFKYTFKKLLLEDLEKDQYVYPKNNEDIDFSIVMGMFMVWMMIYALVTLPIFMGLSEIGALMFLAYFLTFVGIPIYQSLEQRINPMIRTEKALELSGKLKGLKHYIEDYSMIQNNRIENINLYDEYVIYAIIFNIKGKLNVQCKQIYKNIKNIFIH